MRKRIIAFLAAVSVFAGIAPCASASGSAPENSAACAILTDAESGVPLYEKHADKAMLIASTTKIMTALVVLESCTLSDTVTIKREWTGVEGSSMYLAEGEVMTVEDLLYGLLLSSGNDAAVALASYTAGSVEAFADMMNARAREMGLVSTSFKNPHGLDAEGHYSTARDLAEITREAMKNEDFVRIVSTQSIDRAGRTLTNHNRLLREYEGTLGVKTGYTKSAGRILVSCAERDGLRLICVTISDADDWADHKALYDWGFSEFRRVRAVDADGVLLKIPVISGLADEVGVRAGDEISVLCRAEDEITVKIEAPRFVYAPVLGNAAAGRAEVYKNGEKTAETPLLFCTDVGRDESLILTLSGRIKRAIFGER